MTDLVVPRRYCGPPSSGNGGWTAGALASLVEPAAAQVEVTLHAPPPLDTTMSVDTEGDLTVAATGTGRVASARVVGDALTAVAPVGPERARRAEEAYVGHTASPFPTCFVCGRDRAPGDGLRIFSGPVDGDPDRVAATWTPFETSTATAWSALDCPGGWAGGLGERPMVLGRMTVRLDALPVVGEQHVVVGEHRDTQGRKTSTATSLYDAAGRLVGTAEQVWISIDPATFG